VRWPDDKKRWCCKHKVLGCQNSLGLRSRFERAIMASPMVPCIVATISFILSVVTFLRFCSTTKNSRLSSSRMAEQEDDVLMCLHPFRQPDLQEGQGSSGRGRFSRAVVKQDSESDCSELQSRTLKPLFGVSANSRYYV